MASVSLRGKQLRKLESFINRTENQLNSILHSLNWTREQTLQKASYVTCPLDPGHKMPASSLEKHVELCSWLKDGYTRSEKEEAPPSSNYFYRNSTYVVPVLIDKDTQHKIISGVAVNGDVPAKDVPRTMERCFAELTPAERFAVYDYVVERARATNKTSSIKLEDLQVDFEKKSNADEQRPPSHLEIKSKMRDYKRRRQSYRGKNVHITRKSYTEVLKEVIENQTEYLKQLVTESEADNERSASKARSDRSPSTADHRGHKRRRSPSPKSDEKQERKSQERRSREHKKKKSHKHHKKHKRTKHSGSEDS